MAALLATLTALSALPLAAAVTRPSLYISLSETEDKIVATISATPGDYLPTYVPALYVEIQMGTESYYAQVWNDNSPKLVSWQGDSWNPAQGDLTLLIDKNELASRYYTVNPNGSGIVEITMLVAWPASYPSAGSDYVTGRPLRVAVSPGSCASSGVIGVFELYYDDTDELLDSFVVPCIPTPTWTPGWNLYSFHLRDFPLYAEASITVNLTGVYSEIAQIASGWEATAECGDGYLPRTDPFDAVFYGADTSTVNSLNESIYEASHGNVWLTDAVVRTTPELDYTNKTPTDIYSLLPERATLTVLVDPNAPMDYRAIYAGRGFIIMKDDDLTVLKHEVGHGFGFCDPDPWGQVVAWWDAVFGKPPLSDFTNATWAWIWEEGGETKKVWAYLVTPPLYKSGEAGDLILRVKANWDAQVVVAPKVAEGSISPSSLTNTLTAGEWTDYEFTYTPPTVSDYLMVEIAFELTADGTELSPARYVLLVTNASISSPCLEPGEPPEFQDLPEDFWEEYSEIVGNYTQFEEPDAVEYALKAYENAQKAKEDYEKALASNDTCVRSLLFEAAQLRMQAAQYYYKAAQLAEEDWEIHDWRILDWGGDAESYAKAAAEYAAKAAQLEMQANLGCPSGFLSGDWGMNPLVWLASAFLGEGGIGINSWRIFGILLFLIGLVVLIKVRSPVLKFFGLLVMIGGALCFAFGGWGGLGLGAGFGAVLIAGLLSPWGIAGFLLILFIIVLAALGGLGKRRR